MTRSLAEQYPGEVKRCRELIYAYHDQGSRRALEAILIRAIRAELDHDVEAMMRSMREMQGCE